MPDMIGCGHRRSFPRMFAEMLIAAGAPAVAIDPDAGNQRALRAYARAGFVRDRIAETETGPVVVMIFTEEREQKARGQEILASAALGLPRLAQPAFGVRR